MNLSTSSSFPRILAFLPNINYSDSYFQSYRRRSFETTRVYVPSPLNFDDVPELLAARLDCACAQCKIPGNPHRANMESLRRYYFRRPERRLPSRNRIYSCHFCCSFPFPINWLPRNVGIILYAAESCKIPIIRKTFSTNPSKVFAICILLPSLTFFPVGGRHFYHFPQHA